MAVPIPPVPAADREALPPVFSTATRREWVAVGSAWIGLSLVSAGAFMSGGGNGAPRWFAVAGFLADGAVWVALTPVLFLVLDRVRSIPGGRVGVAAAYLVIGAIASTSHAALTRPLVVLLAGVAGQPVDPGATIWRFAAGDFFNYWFAVAAHALIQRGHRDRLRRDRAARLEALLARARLAALTRELEPHFLFNTLNGIAALVRDDPKRAEGMLLRLSDLLRVTLETDDGGELALGEELERLDLYLDIQRMRFGPRLVVELAVAPETIGARVPTLLLQPLVENAVTHGVGSRPGNGMIRISARMDAGRLRLEVRDDGRGVGPGPTRERTGLGNTRARLAAMFQDDFSLTLEPAPGGGAVTTVLIPFEPPRSATGSALVPMETGCE
ncbi:MAG: histidine kinase [Gemmatimonadales bacterium]|nr:histidine kinase [Gemmatimonadales bacterium]